MAWHCKPGCTECCQNIPMEERFLRENMSVVCNPILRIIPGPKYVYPVTANGKCPFLKKSGRCRVYKKRPEVCRLYGKIDLMPCPYVTQDGRLRTPKEVEETQLKIDEVQTKMIVECKDSVNMAWLVETMKARAWAIQRSQEAHE